MTHTLDSSGGEVMPALYSVKRSPIHVTLEIITTKNSACALYGGMYRSYQNDLFSIGAARTPPHAQSSRQAHSFNMQMHGDKMCATRCGVGANEDRVLC